MSHASGTSGLFEQLALIEATAFQDFDFTSICSEVIESLLRAPEIPAVFDLPHVDKRLLIMPEDAFDPDLPRPQDIVCLRMNGLSRCQEKSRLLNAIFGDCPSRRPCTCFLFRQPRGETRHAARLLHHSSWIEWSIPSSSSGECGGGLVLDGGWHPDSIFHVGKVMRKFVSTLAQKHSACARILVSGREHEPPWMPDLASGGMRPRSCA